MFCNIQVDVNGEHLFIVDKMSEWFRHFPLSGSALRGCLATSEWLSAEPNILANYSSRVSKLVEKVTNHAKLVFNDFPGAAECFELITRFCYNNGTIEVTPSNIFLLHSGSSFLEITTLIKQTELYLEGIHCWTWSDFVNGLKQCHILYPFMKNSSVFQNILNTLLRNLTISSYESSSCPSSSNGSSDSSPKGSRFGTGVDYWKFDDLSFLSIDLFEYLIKSMISLHIDQTRICSLIFHYQKSKFFSSYSPLQKCKVSETNINLLSLLSGSAFSGRALLDAFGMSLILNMRAIERSKLEYFLGSRLDEFTINDLLVRGKNMAAFDVNLILRLIKNFLLEKRTNGSFVHRVKKVGFLIDLFMLEVAADPLLKCSKFYALAMTLPDFARESHDRLCHAIEIYLEVHGGLSEEQSAKLWSVLDLNKLSMVRTRLNLTRNGNTRLLPFVKQNRFKGRINNDSRVHGKQRSKVPQDTPNFKPKKSRTLDPCNAKSLPRLCR